MALCRRRSFFFWTLVAASLQSGLAQLLRGVAVGLRGLAQRLIATIGIKGSMRGDIGDEGIHYLGILWAIDPMVVMSVVMLALMPLGHLQRGDP